MIQLLATLLTTIGALFAGFQAAWSAAVGGGIGIVTTACFAYWVFAPGVGVPAKRVLARFVVGEIVKILLTVALFAAAIVWLEAAFLPMLGAFAATLLAYWLVLPLSVNASVRTL